MKALYIFILLTALFLIYTAAIYLKPKFAAGEEITRTTDGDGRLVWQKYNCQSCHQLYGLGGYLGPDLTNIYSTPGKGETYIKAMLKSGVSQMPVFELTDDEQNSLIGFLRGVDESGAADPRTFASDNFGMIHKK